MTTKPRAVTLHDVASVAGVAVSTVSRALSQPGRVGARTREHVQAVAQELGYRPNQLARALPSGRSMLLALLVPDITNPHNFGIIRGAEAEARAAGYTLILGDSQEDGDLERGHVDRLGPMVDGFVLTGSRMPDADLLAAAGRAPVVLFNRQAGDVPAVVTDAADGARQIVEHLHALGHRSIAYLGGPRNSWIGEVRSDGLSVAAQAAGMSIQHLGPFSPHVEQGAAAADVGLAGGATALVAYNDLLAIGVLQRLEQRGVAVPGDVSVAGFDDVFGSAFCRPALTTVTTPAEQAGRTLMDVLLGTRPGGAGPIVLPTPLHVRDSTGPVPGGDRGR